MADILVKALMGKEDLLLGSGTSSQTRNGTAYAINKINSATIPYDGTAVGGTAATTKEMITPINGMASIKTALMSEEVRIAKEYVDVDYMETDGDGLGGRYWWNPSGDTNNHDGLTIIDPDHSEVPSATPGNAWYSDEGGGATGAWERVETMVSSGADGKTTIKSVGTATANSDLDITPAGTGDVNVTTGDVILADGAVNASTTVTAGTSIVAGTDITSTAGDISTAAGSITSATTITATSGDITATNGNIVIGTDGKGIDFSASESGGVVSSLLDDYEEGTFDPTIITSNGNQDSVYVNQYGSYTKIGDKVSFSLEVQSSSCASGTGNVRIGGLPFTASSTGGANDTPSGYPCSIYPSQAVDNFTGEFLVAAVVNATTYVALYQITAALAVSFHPIEPTDTLLYMVSGHYYV